MVKAISGVMTVRFKNELVRNITIKLGYANAKVGVCSDHLQISHYSFSTPTPLLLLLLLPILPMFDIDLQM